MGWALPVGSFASLEIGGRVRLSPRTTSVALIEGVKVFAASARGDADPAAGSEPCHREPHPEAVEADSICPYPTSHPPPNYAPDEVVVKFDFLVKELTTMSRIGIAKDTQYPNFSISIGSMGCNVSPAAY